MCRNDPGRQMAGTAQAASRGSGCAALLVACLALWASACAPSGSLQAMANQPRYDPLAPSNFFPNGMSAQPVISDTVAYGQPMTDTLLYVGTVGGQPAATFPFPVTQEVMLRGQTRFNVFCSPCHGAVGDGQGIVAQRGFCCPASFHTDRLRSAPAGLFFDVITNGFGRMPAYATEIPVRDRWAIIAYVRALQLSQHAALDDVPPDQRNFSTAPTPAP
jgi:hypothetical protein